MIRKEISGLHIYNRNNGLHVLFDEIKYQYEDIQKNGPRQLSIMLTKICNLDCHFCYMEKEKTEIDFTLMLKILEACENLNILDITLGGGEPTLYTNLSRIIDKVYNEYSFGISITTNGTNFKVLEQLNFKISAIRFSLDIYYRKITPYFLQNLKSLSLKQNIGINLLYSQDSKCQIIDIITTLLQNNIDDILLIPEHLHGNFVLQSQDWHDLQYIIDKFQNIADIKITTNATKYLKLKTLITSNEKEFLFLHIDNNGNVKQYSWSDTISTIHSHDNVKDIANIIRQLNPGI